MVFQRGASLLPYNTFGIDASAEVLVEAVSEDDVQAIAHDRALPIQKRVLGGGSNVLLTGPIPGAVVLNRIPGIAVEKEDGTHTWLRVGGGEDWHRFVMHCIAHDLGGVENLALIWGTVGAAPIQNIGAYGVEAKETIASIRGWHWEEKTFVEFSAEDCHFGYRDSIFKRALKDKVFITSVLFRLRKAPTEFNVGYGAIREELESAGHTVPTLRSIADAIIAIRSSKLPDPRQVGNAGSFFKNPTVPRAQYEALVAQHPAMPSYPVDEALVKIPAGWLIEQCSLKGYREDVVGVHARQALVLVNHGGARGADVWALSEKVLRAVQEKFGVALEREVQVWP
jgi:UDP-N-acetylmuramate dehydrogenase